MQGQGEQHFLLICPTEKILSKHLRAHGNLKGTDSVPLTGPHAALSRVTLDPTPPHPTEELAKEGRKVMPDLDVRPSSVAPDPAESRGAPHLHRIPRLSEAPWEARLPGSPRPWRAPGALPTSTRGSW